MGAEPRQLHVAFFPLMAPGHTLPTLDIIRLFASRGVRTTVLTTPRNAPDIAKSLDSRTAIEVVPFPSEEGGIPEGIESLDKSANPQVSIEFMKSVQLFREPLEKFLEKTRPDCLVADLFLPFATEAAGRLGIPRLVFHGSSFIAMCIGDATKRHEPHKAVGSDDEPFLVPHFPHEIELTKSQLFAEEKEPNEATEEFMKLVVASLEAEAKSYGVIFNSFYELENDYVDYYRNVMGRKAWHIGPVSLCRRSIEEKSQRGRVASIDKDECLRWLDSKEANSVIYVCFGSLAGFTSPQLKEIGKALEASGLDFVWAVRTSKEQEMENDWLPEGFEKRIEGKGLIIRGWSPQVLILEHEAIGGFVTHCGWNSTLEGISAGVPMVTWPLFADQFFNEKLVTDVLKIGVKVGSKVWNSNIEGPILRQKEIEMAMKRIMAGEEALEMRDKAKKFKEMASKAVEEDGSSYNDLSSLIHELKCYKH